MPENQSAAYKGLHRTAQFRRLKDTSAITKNRIDALSVLVRSISFEIGELKRDDVSDETDAIVFDEEVQRFECELIRCALMKTGGIQRKAAALLNIKVTTLNAKIKRFGICPNGLIGDGSSN
jgi:transcriptional regulator with GAF, ATPase, and Fis domain